MTNVQIPLSELDWTLVIPWTLGLGHWTFPRGVGQSGVAAGVGSRRPGVQIPPPRLEIERFVAFICGEPFLFRCQRVATSFRAVPWLQTVASVSPPTIMSPL